MDGLTFEQSKDLWGDCLRYCRGVARQVDDTTSREQDRARLVTQITPGNRIIFEGKDITDRVRRQVFHIFGSMYEARKDGDPSFTFMVFNHVPHTTDVYRLDDYDANLPLKDSVGGAPWCDSWITKWTPHVPRPFYDHVLESALNKMYGKRGIHVEQREVFNLRIEMDCGARTQRADQLGTIERVRAKALRMTWPAPAVTLNSPRTVHENDVQVSLPSAGSPLPSDTWRITKLPELLKLIGGHKLRQAAAAA